jgi:hypothetical protein
LHLQHTLSNTPTCPSLAPNTSIQACESMAKSNGAAVLTSTEVNYLIYRYLQESGKPCRLVDRGLLLQQQQRWLVNSIGPLSAAQDSTTRLLLLHTKAKCTDAI